MKLKRIVGFALLAGIVGVQFFRPAKNISSTKTGNEIEAMYSVPADVKDLLTVACMDCHSNNTRYPWYANIQPVGIWLNKHVVDGKKHLNFDEFGAGNLRRQYHKMEEVEEMIEGGEMPLSSYTLIHGDAKLDEAKKTLLIDWSKAVRKEMESKYPMDSLVRKRK